MKYSILGLYFAISWLGINNQITTKHYYSSSQLYQPVAISKNCPREINTLIPLLLEDLPNYANRIIQKSNSLDKYLSPIYVLVAGKPEYEPLNLSSSEAPPLPQADKDVRQIFFTTLERRYLNNKAIEAENYHWLFLTQTANGWKLVMLFSRFGFSSKQQPPSPTKENNNGIIAQAVRLWLRDCNTGNLRN